jgi:hypothetical protein
VSARWVPVPGWGDAYLVDPATGRVRSRDRWVVDRRGARRWLTGVELQQAPVSRSVYLCHRGVRRAFTPEGLRRLVGAL